MDALQGGLSREETQGTLLQHFPPDALFTKKNLFVWPFLTQLLISIPWTGTFAFYCQKKRNRKAFFGPTGTYGFWILKSSSIPHHLKGFHLLNNLKMQTAMIFVGSFDDGCHQNYCSGCQM